MADATAPLDAPVALAPRPADSPTGELALATERYQRAALDAIPEAWVFLRSLRDGRRVVDFAVIDMNAAAERLAGRPRAAVIGTRLRECFPVQVRLDLHDTYVAVAEGRVSFDDERCVYTEAGEEQWLHVRAVPIPGGLALFTRDISDRRRAESARARLAAILEETPDVVTVSDIDGRLQYLNGAGRAMLGLPPQRSADGAYDLSMADVQPQLMPGGALEEATRIAAREGTWRGETVLRKRDGRDVPVEQVLIAHFGADGRPTYYSSVMRDITDRKQAEAALRSLSLVDELTTLYNRRGFLTVAGQALDRARERGAPVLVFYMDMDDFKRINDGHGHAEGDVALRTVADVLRATFRESDVIGRLGGDEFVAFAVHGVGDGRGGDRPRRDRSHRAAARRGERRARPVVRAEPQRRRGERVARAARRRLGAAHAGGPARQRGRRAVRGEVPPEGPPNDVTSSPRSAPRTRTPAATRRRSRPRRASRRGCRA
ncbi:diguanylate cyclase [Gemmatirosa kalamazoonensis]|uniref:Diguanylate cyclase n=1 Tax=Gemmatirosa kalamazoonensis TaxID=861299 RepID=W0RM03_9BACT|nr:diguanylate cyclase [Gemmatirosa kalamazoonensis]AHG91340.1 diguanylate cyclase [Gemmatirosa kalamazoonensis]